MAHTYPVFPPSGPVHSTERDCIRRLSAYTPALEAIEYYDTDLDFSSNNESTYQGPPTEERERAWTELWHHEAVMVPSWEMPKLNRTKLDRYEKVNPEKGDGYVAIIEVYHQLACLYTWFLMGGYPEDRIPEILTKWPEQNRQRVDSCIDRLRERLMCNGDMTPVLVTKERDKFSGWRADFNTHHRCRDFTKLNGWAAAHGVEDWAKNGEHSH
ncbi:hypothetical protein FQN49_001367 [Arthroderma sp. PD_2]|nr:hypothetical protein FQN49_001367 [Arthroderma sp. PD_2]